MTKTHPAASLLAIAALPLLAACGASSDALEPSTPVVVGAGSADAGASGGGAATTPGTSGGGGASGGSSGGSSGGIPSGGGSDAPAAGNCTEAAKLVYLVSKQKELWSFNPALAGAAAYRRVGALRCNTTSSPQTMGVDRTGTAWVFYSDGSLHKVDVTTASCTSTGFTYPDVVPFEGLNLGSGFTALGGDPTRETLFLLRSAEGLSTFETNARRLTETGKLVGSLGELTGGPDGRLFAFNPMGTPKISEVNTTTFALTPVKTFASSFFSGVRSFALSRYAGAFYMFTATLDIDGIATGPSKVTVYDPSTDALTTRDANVGFTVVGAGQSVCVPPPAIR
jgi:hypothetical protein